MNLVSRSFSAPSRIGINPPPEAPHTSGCELFSRKPGPGSSPHNPVGYLPQARKDTVARFSELTMSPTPGVELSAMKTANDLLRGKDLSASDVRDAATQFVLAAA